MASRTPTSPSRADDLAHELQVEIMTGRIPLGTRLRQEDLAARFGAGNAVRAAVETAREVLKERASAASRSPTP